MSKELFEPQYVILNKRLINYQGHVLECTPEFTSIRQAQQFLDDNGINGSVVKFFNY